MKHKSLHLRIFAVLLAVLALLVFLHLSGGKSALARYKSNLRAKGEKLTFAELAIPLSTNAAEVASRQFFASFVLSNSSLVAGPTPKLMDFAAPGKARPSWRGDLRLDNGSAVIPGDWNSLDRQNADAAPSLAPVTDALQNPAPETGWIFDDNYDKAIAGPPRTFIRDRTLAQAFVRAEIGALHRGDLDAAIASLHALIGFSRMNRNELTLVSQMMRVSFGGMALNGTWEALQAPGWDETRLAALQKDWEQVEILEGIERAMMAERAFFQLVMTRVRHSSGTQLAQIVNPPSARVSGTSGTAGHSLKALWTEQLDPFLYRMTSVNEDELFELQHITAMVELARQLKANRPWPEISLASSNMYKELDRRFGEDHFHRLRVSAIAIPSFARVFSTTAHTETQRRLTITAIAGKRYQLKHGAPPPSLDALVPEFLSAVPIDPMSGRPLRYRLNADGAFVLYSVGEDGVDDGGDSTPRETGGKPGLWEGRDAVWPTAASPEEEAAFKK